MGERQQLQGGPTAHRAIYLLERGVWRATCRECGWRTSDASRRQAAALFRAHIYSSRRIIDLTDGATTTEDADLVVNRERPTNGPLVAS